MNSISYQLLRPVTTGRPTPARRRGRSLGNSLEALIFGQGCNGVHGTKRRNARGAIVIALLLSLVLVNFPLVPAYAEEGAPAETQNSEAVPPPAEGTDATNDTSSSENTATPPAETASENGAVVVTGDAGADANAVNAVNTNVTNGEIDVIALNSSSSTEEIDLRPDIATSSSQGLPCPDGGCESAINLTTENQNDATVESEIVVSAVTGGNSASAGSSCGDAAVLTGNATAGANVVNLVNTNVVNSRLLVVTINKLGDWLGDLVFPGRQLFEGFSTNVPPNLEVSNANEATVSNEVSVNAETGANAATAGNEAAIATGNAMALANIVNFINTNLVGGGSFTLLLQIGGSWTGTVFSLPPGASLSQNGQMVSIHYDAAGASGPSTDSTSSPQASLGAGGAGSLAVSNGNGAAIENRVIVLASTGGNSAASDCGNAGILTGDALAAANVLNIANSNVISSNWFLALVNVAGDWGGSLAFGRPDLWIGKSASLSALAPIGMGYRITYKLTIVNRGDADATDVVLDDYFDADHLTLEDPGGGTVVEDGHIRWDIGTLPIGESEMRSYTVAVTDLPEGATWLSSNGGIDGYEPDANAANNTDSMAILADRHINGHPQGSWPPELVMTKTHGATSTPIAAPGTVHYTLALKNTGGGISYHTNVFDAVKAPDGSVVNAGEWDLGDVFPGETVIITYDLEFAASSLPGAYENSAYAEGLGGSQDGYSVLSNIANSTVTVAGEGVAESQAGDGTTEELNDPQAAIAAFSAPNPTAVLPPAAIEPDGPSLGEIISSSFPEALAAPPPPPFSRRQERGGLAALFLAGAWPFGPDFLILFLLAILGAMLLRNLEERQRRARPPPRRRR